MTVRASPREPVIRTYLKRTAGGPHRPVLSAKEPFLPGFEAFSSSLVGQHG
jgi:hypothetical protein